MLVGVRGRGIAIAKESDMKKHVANADPTSVSIKADADELQWMSQWGPEDELVDYSPELSRSESSF